jgi:hypothetical protein
VAAGELIQRAPGACGTELLRVIGDPDRLIAIAQWENKASRDAMESQHNPDVAEIVRSAAAFCEIRPIGEFEDPERVVNCYRYSNPRTRIECRVGSLYGYRIR